MMKSYKFRLGLFLFLLGLAGVLSILTMELPLPEEAKKRILEKVSPEQLKWILLVNPALMVLLAVLLGTAFFEQAGLKVPLLTSLLLREKPVISARSIVVYGVTGGVVAGLLIVLITLFFQPILPQAFLELGAKVKPTVVARFLYGGLTEEILMRYGLMTFFVWLFIKLFKSTSPQVYQAGLLITALLFAVGHFPVAYQAVGTPSAGLLTYLVLGNAVGGLIFGWLYWKKGLEAACIAHIMAHVVLLLGEPLSG